LPTIKTYGSIEIQCNANKQIDIALVMKKILETIGTLDVEGTLAVMDINVKRDTLTIQALAIKQQISLGHLYPDIAKEWPAEKNGDLSATNILQGSMLRVHWKCRDSSEE
jgi:Probable Zinc-ribbon domain